MNGWILAIAAAAATTLLINAGIAKLVAPDTLVQALTEAMPLRGRRPGESSTRRLAALVRMFALAELLVATALLIPAARRGTAFAVLAMGALFLAFGVVGIVRRSTLPCGCLGGTTRHALGVFNIAFGLVLMLIGAIELASALPSRPGSAGAVLLAAIGTLSLCLWLHRPVITELVFARDRASLPYPASTRT
jgi:hypothetical protein